MRKGGACYAEAVESTPAASEDSNRTQTKEVSGPDVSPILPLADFLDPLQGGESGKLAFNHPERCRRLPLPTSSTCVPRLAVAPIRS